MKYRYFPRQMPAIWVIWSAFFPQSTMISDWSLIDEVESNAFSNMIDLTAIWLQSSFVCQNFGHDFYMVELHLFSNRIRPISKCEKHTHTHTIADSWLLVMLREKRHTSNFNLTDLKRSRMGNSKISIAIFYRYIESKQFIICLFPFFLYKNECPSTNFLVTTQSMLSNVMLFLYRNFRIRQCNWWRRFLAIEPKNEEEQLTSTKAASPIEFWNVIGCQIRILCVVVVMAWKSIRFAFTFTLSANRFSQHFNEMYTKNRTRFK